MAHRSVPLRHRGDDDDRRALEADLAELAETVEDVAWLAVARSVDEPDVTGLLSLFADEEALARYREHPRHQPVVARARQLCAEISRLDVEAGTP